MSPEEILSSDEKRICVIAAPGSGKTKRILIPKVVRVLDDPGVAPNEVILLSFSRLSAKDLKERVRNLGARAPRATTVHALCLAFLLSENDHDIRSRVESIVLDFEKETLIADLKLTFPNVHKRELESTLKEFSAGWATQPHEQVLEGNDFQRAFKSAVFNWLSEHKAAMMEEIVCGAVTLARQIGTSKFISTPQYILVDEYQDLNKLEQEFIDILAEDSKLLLAVGDPDQSIYGFKYSYPSGIEGFSRRSDVRSWYSLITGRCPPNVVSVANQLIQQSRPNTNNLLRPLNESPVGEVKFVRRDTQEDEFDFVARSIADRLRSGTRPNDILVLVPKRKLGAEFSQYFNSVRSALGISDNHSCVFESKIELSDYEKTRILLMSLAVRPDSVLHLRSYLSVGASDANAANVAHLKQKYGTLSNALEKADPKDFPLRNIKVRSLCSQLISLREFIAEHRAAELDPTLDILFPPDNEETQRIRTLLQKLREGDDTLASLYGKFVEHLRDVPVDENTVRCMTLMASKGLEAPHVYIIGCNAGNIPGTNRTAHMSDHEYREEQRRLLFVGITRSNSTLMITWARRIPFAQSLRHHTRGVAVRRSREGTLLTDVGICPFLQDLTNVQWGS